MNDTNDIYDSTSNNHDGTNYGTTTETGQIGGCRYFDSTSDQYNFGNNAELNPETNSWTISAWTKITDMNNSFMLIKYASKEYDLFMYNNKAFFRVYDGTHLAYRYWDTQWRDGNWHLLTIVINRNTNKIDLYLDGNLDNGIGTGDLTQVESITNTANLFLRCGNDGKIDELRIETTARDNNWIKTSYNNQQNPSNFHIIGNEETAPSENHAPSLSSETPPDGSTNIIVIQDKIQVNIEDLEGDPFDWIVKVHDFHLVLFLHFQ
jgi:hypothetical protein